MNNKEIRELAIELFDNLEPKYQRRVIGFMSAILENSEKQEEEK